MVVFRFVSPVLLAPFVSSLLAAAPFLSRAGWTETSASCCCSHHCFLFFLSFAFAKAGQPEYERTTTTALVLVQAAISVVSLLPF
jgi:hypothetical protein